MSQPVRISVVSADATDLLAMLFRNVYEVGAVQPEGGPPILCVRLESVEQLPELQHLILTEIKAPATAKLARWMSSQQERGTGRMVVMWPRIAVTAKPRPS